MSGTGSKCKMGVIECIRIQKRVIPLNRGQFGDEKQGVVFQIWITGSLDLGKNRVKITNFSHFEFGHTFFQIIGFKVIIFVGIFQICMVMLPSNLGKRQ